MAKRKCTAEEIVTVLRQVEVSIANGKEGLPEVGHPRADYYRWRKEYGVLKLEQAKRLKELKRENSRLKRLVAELARKADPARRRPGKLVSPEHCSIRGTEPVLRTPASLG